MMPPKKLKSVVVPQAKRNQEVVQVPHEEELPAKRTRSPEADPKIIMTITQPVDKPTKGKKVNKPKHNPKSNPALSRDGETSISCNSASFAHPPPRVQYASNAALFPGQHQP